MTVGLAFSFFKGWPRGNQPFGHGLGHHPAVDHFGHDGRRDVRFNLAESDVTQKGFAVRRYPAEVIDEDVGVNECTESARAKS